jgi:Flp pilus assembly protein TadG
MTARPRQRGQSMLEFAFVIPLFLLLLLGLIDFSRLLFTYVSVANGARELSRTVSISSNSMSSVVNAFNNLTIFGGSTNPASTVSFAPSGGGSGTIICSGSTDNLCTLQVTTGPSTTPNCPSATVCLNPVGTGASGSASYNSSGFNYTFNPASSGTGTDYIVLTWLSADANTGLQQGYIQVCRLPFTSTCAFPSSLSTASQRSGITDGLIQTDIRYTFQFNPLFQNRLAGVIDVSFMRPSSQITTTVRTYAE